MCKFLRLFLSLSLVLLKDPVIQAILVSRDLDGVKLHTGHCMTVISTAPQHSSSLRL